MRLDSTQENLRFSRQQFCKPKGFATERQSQESICYQPPNQLGHYQFTPTGMTLTL
jgi:hypothetical protein